MQDFIESLSPNKLFDGHYKLIRQLGNKSATVSIWLARDVNTIDNNASANDESSGKLVSIMICHPTTALDFEDEQRWQDEFDAVYDCRHPNLLPPEEYAIVNDTYYLVFPYTETDSLRQCVGKNMSDRAVCKLVSDIASGLHELHAHQPQITHGDIRPSNILVFDNERFALTNYGIHFETDAQRIDNHVASMAYMAPERFQGASSPNPESDIWAFGATLYEVLSGDRPFGREGGKNQRHDTPMPPLADYSDEIRDLVYACLQCDPQKRPTAQQIRDAARSKKSIFKLKKKKEPERTKKSLNNDNRKKVVIPIAATVFLLLGILVFVLIPHQHNEDIIQKDVVVEVDNFEKAINMLQEKSTAENGLHLLESLASEKKEWKAAFLLSRLYFDTRITDTVFYEKQWEKMRDNCEIVPDNEKAHKYLFDAFEFNNNDFMILYQLGCDFLAGEKRGCKRKTDYALWCFNAADSLLNSSGSNNVRYREELNDKRNRLKDQSPLKPSTRKL